MMFPLVTSVILLVLTTALIVYKFGWWAGLVVGGMPVINIVIDHAVVGDLTTFRTMFNSLYAFLLLVAYTKTVNKLNL